MADDPGKGDSGYNQQNQLGNDMNEETAHSPNKSAFVNGTEVAYNNITISDKITIEHHIRVIPMVPVVDSHGSNINFKEELQRESLHVSVLKGEEITDEEDEEDDEEDWISDDGVESDVEDNLEIAFPLRKRESNPQLPETVTALDTPHGCKVYVVGTAHFSTESQDDVSKVIRAVQPDVVMVELCKSRINILELDEAMLLEEAKNINLEKFRLAIKQSGVVQGMMHLLLLSMSAHLTKQLGMAPGGEFRRAFQEAKKVPGCRLHLGDRPIQITLKRALGALSVWQKMKLAWYLITSKDPISKEDVEKCKQRDLLEQLLKEMTGEFPALSRVFVDERDIYLTHSLKTAAQPRDTLDMPEGFVPTVVVGVVGIGHVPGIISNWNKDQDIREIMIIPPGTVVGTVLRWSIRASLLGIFSYGCYRFFRWTAHVFWK